MKLTIEFNDCQEATMYMKGIDALKALDVLDTKIHNAVQQYEEGSPERDGLLIVNQLLLDVMDLFQLHGICTEEQGKES